MPHFEEYHRRELHRIFTELADFVHEHELTQIVGAGPSAYPYTLALERAYNRRYGQNARKLNVVNLGRVGEDPAIMAVGRGFDAEAARAVLRSKPSLDFGRKTLILEDIVRTKFSLSALRNAFNALNIPNKTAAIANVSLMRTGLWPNPDYVGSRDIEMNRAHFSRGRQFTVKVEQPRSSPLSRMFGAEPAQELFTRPSAEWAAKMRGFHSELREIANKVEPKNAR